MRLILAIVFAVPLFSQNSLAYEAGGVRALQQGPAGGNIGFYPLKKEQLEFSIGVRSIERNVSSGEDSTSKSHNVIDSSLAGGFVLSPELQFIVEAREINTFYDGISHHSYEVPGVKNGTLKAGPIFRGENLLIGGTVGATMLTALTFVPQDALVDSISVDSAFFPHAAGFIGLNASGFQATLGLKVYNGKAVSVDYSSTEIEENDYQTPSSVVRSTPGEGQFDIQLKASEDLNLGISWTYVTSIQGNNNLDSRDPLLELYPDSTNHIKVDLGGIYYANPQVALVGAMHYKQSSHLDKEDINGYRENIGGYRFDVGIHQWHTRSKYFFNLAYQLPSREPGTKTLFDEDTYEYRTREQSLELSYWEMVIGGTWDL